MRRRRSVSLDLESSDATLVEGLTLTYDRDRGPVSTNARLVTTESFQILGIRAQIGWSIRR
jgi:hypothetical protein